MNTRKIVQFMTVSVWGVVFVAFASNAAGQIPALSLPSPTAKQISNRESTITTVTEVKQHRLSEAEIVLLAERYMSIPKHWRKNLLFQSDYDNDSKMWTVVIHQIAPPNKEGWLGISEWATYLEYNDYGELVEVSGHMSLPSLPSPAEKQISSRESTITRGKRHRLSEAEIVLLAERYMAKPVRWRKNLLFESDYDNSSKTWLVAVHQIAPPNKTGRLSMSQWATYLKYNDYGEVIDISGGY